MMLGELPAFLMQYVDEKDKAVREAVEETMAEAVEIVKRNAPVDTGALRDSVHAVETMIAVDVPYAYYVEYGTSKMAPRHFVLNSMPEIEEALLRNLEKALR